MVRQLSCVLRLTTGQIGTLILIGSLSFFFGAMILAFGFRIEADRTWQRFDVPGILWLGTAFLAMSSWTLEAGRKALRQALVAIYRGRIVATLALSVMFLGVQVASARLLLAQGVAAAANPHGSVFYVFMGIHAIHMCCGIGWMTYLYRKSRLLYRGTETDLRRHRRALSAAALYWHFMGVLWLLLYYLLIRWTAG